MTNQWTLNLLVYRLKGNGAPHYDSFKIKANPDEYVLDLVERIWAFEDRTLTFAHACHHSTCGACGMRINGVEKLTCITPVHTVAKDGATVKVEPLRNFPVISDLAVDMGSLFRRMEQVGHRPVLELADEPAEPGIMRSQKAEDREIIRLADCIECGLCISACPIATTTPEYLGPAVLAGAQQSGIQNNRKLLALIDSQNGAWRCHSAFECTAVCPSNVEPAWRIMDLRMQVMSERIKNWLRSGK